MIRCPSCGTENPGNALFCASCGQGLQNPPASIPIPAPIPMNAFPTPQGNEQQKKTLTDSVIPDVSIQSQKEVVTMPKGVIPDALISTEPEVSQDPSLISMDGMKKMPVPEPTPPTTNNMSESLQSFSLPDAIVSSQKTESSDGKEQAPTATNGQEGTISYAGFWRRTGGYIIDILLINILSSIINSLLTIFIPQNPVSSHLQNIAVQENVQVPVVGISLILTILYFIFFWTHENGQTLGAKVFGFRVIKEDGNPFTIGTAVIRYIGLVLSFFVFFLGVLWVAFSKKKQGWHDMIAKTVVVKV